MSQPDWIRVRSRRSRRIARVASGFLGAMWAACAVASCLPPSPRVDAVRACPVDVQQPDDLEAWQCPSPASGSVVVDARFDADLDGVLSYCEIQCAIDCLDGDSHQERTLASYEGSKRPDSAPPAIRGGELIFDPRLTYRTDRPLALPLLVEGSLNLRGNGARLELVLSSSSPSRSFAAIERMPLPGSNQCDVAVMSELGSGWTIENFWIALGVPDESVRASRQLKGIEIQGARQLAIRSCQFRASSGGGFDTAIELHACRDCLVESPMLTMTRRVAVMVGDARGCGDDGSDACWLPCSCPTSGPRWLARWAPCTTSSGSDGTVVRNARLYTGGPPTYPKSVGIRVRSSADVVIDAPTFEGGRPLHYVQRDGTDGACTLRNPRFECASSMASPLIENAAPGTFVIDAPEIVAQGSAPQWFYDVGAASAGSLTVLQDAPLGVLGSLRLSASPHPAVRDAQYFAFVNLGAPMQDASYWIGAVPRFTLALSPERWVLPPEPDAARSDPSPRQIWIDDGQLKFCCDPNGRVLKALTETVVAPVAPGP